jgi:hypothetical protein
VEFLSTRQFCGKKDGERLSIANYSWAGFGDQDHELVYVFTGYETIWGHQPLAQEAAK